MVKRHTGEIPYFINKILFKKLLSFDQFELSDFKRINVFIGGNSSGKSNIIRAIIGFAHDKGREHESSASISFLDGEVITGKDEKKYRDRFIEIPPFRNLVIPDGCSLVENNWKKGVINIAKIGKKKKDFYKQLNKIIGIEGFELDSKKGLPTITYDGSLLKAEGWTNWGSHSRIVRGQPKTLPIDNLGWGTKSAIIIFYNLFFRDEAIYFIEEPEISMHPELLKKLLRWSFRERPKCQFFITTHSSMLIDKIFLGDDNINDVSIYKIYNDRGITRGTSLNDKKDQIKLLEHLGFQSSNLLFANYVIWVEGPSDIFYYEAFLNIMDKLRGDKGIRRGIHYEIMWYGGSMEGRLIDVESPKDLPTLFSFTRHGAIFWDFDKDYVKKSGKQAPNDTHEKILEYSNHKELEGRFIVGCAGEILKGNMYSRDVLPLAIENLVPRSIYDEIVSPKSTALPPILDKLSQNDELTPEEKSTLNNYNKIRLGKAFLARVRQLIEETNTKEIKAILSGPPFGDVKAAFFGELLEEIEKASR